MTDTRPTPESDALFLHQPDLQTAYEGCQRLERRLAYAERKYALLLDAAYDGARMEEAFHALHCGSYAGESCSCLGREGAGHPLARADVVRYDDGDEEP